MRRLDARTREFKERGEFSDMHEPFLESLRKRQASIKNKLDSAIQHGAKRDLIKYEAARFMLSASSCFSHCKNSSVNPLKSRSAENSHVVRSLVAHLDFFLILVLQPLFTGRWYGLRRAQAIRAIEKSHGSRVITMIHRQEKRSLFGFAVARHIDLEDAQTIIAAIKDTPDDMPIDLVIHTPGGLVLAAMQIARAVEAHKAKVTVYVPVYAMSGGTLLALAADEIRARRVLGARSDRSADCWIPGCEHCQSP
jgi:Serine dehydrogenase proteinase